MVYAYDKWMQLPVRDLYDTQMMLAAIGAAKDMYEKGVLQIKDFKKEYGDFYSPILSDMDWYKENVTDPITNTINDLYAKGIDPVRSVEGRAAVSKLINSVNTGEIAQKKRQAEAAESYIKSRDALKKAGLWNPEYERQMLGGLLLEEWDGSLGNWTATSASPYQDYHQKYNHLFKDMDYEYDEEESKKHPGMIAMTRSKSRMHDILNSVRKDLENDPQYQYDLKNLLDLVQSKNPDLSPKDALSTARKMLEDEIVERNYGGGMKLIEDPIQRENRAFLNQVKLENIRYSHQKALRDNPTDPKNQKINEVGSYNLSLFARGLAKWSGSTDPGIKGLEKAVNFGKEKANLPTHQMNKVFLNYYSMNDAETSSSWITRMSAQDNSRTKDAAPGGVLYIPTQDRSKLYTLGELTSNTLGNVNLPYREYGPLSTTKDNKQSKNNLSMVPTGKVYTAPMKNGSYEQFAEVRVGNEDGQKTYYYKIYQSEPAPVIPNTVDYSRGWIYNSYLNDGIISPGGYSVLPSESTLNSWLIPERALNHAIGLGSESMKSGNAELLDNLDMNYYNLP